mmetsp:Transcript_8752/g.21578  ORF Transcript_8752/g.21578 Transcript_8752/m.21578 type:complete len:84 (-) Transcript_8752:1038-1289(-)
MSAFDLMMRNASKGPVRKKQKNESQSQKKKRAGERHRKQAKLIYGMLHIEGSEQDEASREVIIRNVRRAKIGSRTERSSRTSS